MTEPKPAADAPRDATLNLHQRMSAAMAAIGYIPKSGQGPESQGSYAFARVEDIKDKVRDELVRVGVMVYVSMDGRDIQVLSGTRRDGSPTTSILATVWGVMTFVNIDAPEERFEVTIHGQGIDSQDKAVSKATTSADKYGLLNAFQIPTGKDPDAEGEDIPTAAPGARPQQSRPQQQAARGPGPGQYQQRPRADGGYSNEPPPDWDGMGAPSNGGPSSGGAVPGGQCPKHQRAWKSGQYGWYCTAKDDTTDRGYCVLKPSGEWAASMER